MIFQLILPVLFTPTNYCFQDQVTFPSDRLLLVNQTFTKLDMVYSDFLWSPPDMVLVLILDSQKYGHHQIYLYWKWPQSIVLQQAIAYISPFSMVSFISYKNYLLKRLW